MNRPVLLAIVACGVFAGSVMNLTDAHGASGKKKHCGDSSGANNGECPKCAGNCDFTDDGNVQKYKVCAGDGDACEDTVESFCSGRLRDGGKDGQGCDGDIVTDDEGDPVSCQNTKFKTCK